MQNDDSININARYFLEPDGIGGFNVVDRARQMRLDALTRVFVNATQQECRDHVTRNCEEPAEHTKGDWEITGLEDEPGRGGKSAHFKIRGTVAGGRFRIANVPYPRSTDATLDAREEAEARANAALIITAPKLLALLEQYHEAMPTLESGALIAEARGWKV